MNLTASVYGLSTEAYYGEQDEEISRWKKNNERYTSLATLLEGIIKGTHNDANIDLFTYENEENNNLIKLDLLRADIELNKIDADIMHIVQSKNNLTREYLLNLDTELPKLYKKYDFVLIDQSPSISGIINAIFSLMSSYVIVPCTPTFFSLQAVNNLLDIWKHWKDLLEPYGVTTNTKGLKLNSNFLGIIIQLGKRYKGGNATHTNKWKEIVNDGLQNFVNSNVSNAINKEQFKSVFPNSSPYIIDTYNHFTDNLRSIIEEKGIPFVALEKNDLPNSNAKNETDNQYLQSWESIQCTNKYICESLSNL